MPKGKGAIPVHPEGGVAMGARGHTLDSFNFVTKSQQKETQGADDSDRENQGQTRDTDKQRPAPQTPDGSR